MLVAPEYGGLGVPFTAFAKFLTRMATIDLTVFFFNYTPTTEIYTLSLHDALPILLIPVHGILAVGLSRWKRRWLKPNSENAGRSEEHTSELQSHHDLVCRLLL